VKRLGVEITSRADIWFEIYAPPALSSQLSYDEYAGLALAVGLWDGEEKN